MPYIQIKQENEKYNVFWKQCEHEGCKNLVLIGFSMWYCSEHCGASEHDLKHKIWMISMQEQERLM
jgi:hypothetical protein